MSEEIRCPENFLLNSVKTEQNASDESFRYVFRCQAPNSDLMTNRKLSSENRMLPSDGENVNAESVDCSGLDFKANVLKKSLTFFNLKTVFRTSVKRLRGCP